MRKLAFFAGIALLFIGVLSCEKEPRNIAKKIKVAVDPGKQQDSIVEIIPVDINKKGFDLLEKMQGQWVGKNLVINDNYDWFAFDYRAISESHIHGIFEGGTMGNLFTSFFVTNFKNTKTIFARNGGLLNGIYRTSYFVLDSVRVDPNGTYYRLVDAKGGDPVMSMELKFVQDSLYFNAYTSRLGRLQVKRHMTFKGKRRTKALAQTAATAVGFPTKKPAWNFSNGFVEADIFVPSSFTKAKSATFITQIQGINDFVTLGEIAKDPYKITDHPYLGNLKVKFKRTKKITCKIFVYLSEKPLTDQLGYLKWTDQDAFNSVLKFPILEAQEEEFSFAYLHPGKYYINIIADVNEDGAISPGDITSVSQSITLNPLESKEITINNINVQN